MRSQPWGLVCLFVLGCSTFLLPAPFVRAEPDTPPSPDPLEARIYRVLDNKVDWEFVDTKLSEIAASMADVLGIDVLLDVNALDDFGFNPETPINFKISGVSTRSFLHLMLRELQLTYVVRDSALWITTHDEAEAQLTTRVYPVGDLVRPLSDEAGLAECGSTIPAEKDAAYEVLTQTITSCIAPDSWDEVGGPGTIEGIYESLVISQTGDVHGQVEELLVRYRELMSAEEAPDGLGVRRLMVGLDEEANLLAALDKPVTAIIRDQPLRRALSVLAEDFQIPIVLDTIALDNIGVDAGTPVTGRFAEVPLRVALKRLLDPLQLTYLRRHEVIMITTPDEEEAMLQLGLYPVGNLVRDGSEDPLDHDFDRLIEVITSTIFPDTWDAVGGPGAINVLLPAPALAVSHTQQVHEQLTKLLITLEATKRGREQKEVDPDAITLKAYGPGLGDPQAVIAVILRDSPVDTWSQENVFIEPLGAAIVVKHNAKVHTRVKKVLKELGVWLPVGRFTGSGGATVPNQPAAENALPQHRGSPGGFF